MNIKVWYKLPSPPVEGSNGVMVPANDMVVTRIYENVKISYNDGVLTVFNAVGTIAVYMDFDRVEPID